MNYQNLVSVFGFDHSWYHAQPQIIVYYLDLPYVLLYQSSLPPYDHGVAPVGDGIEACVTGKDQLPRR